MDKEKLTDIITLYNKYKGKKASSASGIINIIGVVLFIGVIVSVTVASLSENVFFGIIIGTVFSFFAAMAAVRFIKQILAAKLPAMKSTFVKKRKERHLYGLTDNEFESFILHCVGKRTQKSFIRKGLFYYSGNIALVILTFPSKPEQAIEKIDIAISDGAESVIVVCKNDKKELIKNMFSDKIEDILTIEDIIKDIQWLDYEDIDLKNKKLSLDSFVKERTVKNFRNIMLVCAVISILTKRISGVFSYYSTLAIFFGILWLSAKIYTALKK